MATDVDICNLALDHVQTKAVLQSLTEESKEAEICNRHYAVARDATLRAFDWGFASAFVYLAKLENQSQTGGYLYTYAYPQNCLRIRELLPESDVITQEKTQSYNYTESYGYKNPKRVEYKLGRIGGSRVIYTNLDEAWARYTAVVEETQQFDSMFVDAFSWVLAAAIAMPVRGNARIATFVQEQRDRVLLEAAGADANEQTDDANFEADWIAARS